VTGRILGMFLCVLVSWNPGPSFADDSVDGPVRLAPLVFQYLDATDSEEADRLLQMIQAHPEASIREVTDMIRSGRVYGEQPTGTFPEQQIFVRGQAYPLSMVVPTSYDPSTGIGLVVCLHGAGFDGEAYLDRWRSRLGDRYILACPTYPYGAWFTRKAEELVVATIHDIRRRYHIDPDRIFLTGMSNGGIGTWLIGMHHASLFAGIAPMASGLDNVLMPFLANLRNTPAYIIHGEKDQVMPVELSRSIVATLKSLEYPYVYREHQGEHPHAGGHYFPKEEVPDLVTWFDSRRRDSMPLKLTVVREASHFQPFSWVRLDVTDPIAVFSDELVDKHDEKMARREYARVDAAIVRPNRIEVKTERVLRYSLFLNERLVDLSKPITVMTNGQISFEGLVMPSLETLLLQARIRKDPGALFSVQLTVNVQKQP